jgi:hypothetical protein
MNPKPLGFRVPGNSFLLGEAVQIKIGAESPVLPPCGGQDEPIEFALTTLDYGIYSYGIYSLNSW